MNCRSLLSPAAQMGDFVGFLGGESGRFRAMISAIVFGGVPFWTAREGARGHGGRFWVRRWALSFAEHEAIFSDLSVRAVRAVGAFGCAVCGGEKEKGSSDAEGAIG